jgi:hypothetical protein
MVQGRVLSIARAAAGRRGHVRRGGLRRDEVLHHRLAHQLRRQQALGEDEVVERLAVEGILQRELRLGAQAEQV